MSGEGHGASRPTSEGSHAPAALGPVFVGKVLAVGVLCALAVAVAVVHPALPGRACREFPSCYLGALASPEDARSLQGGVVLLVAMGKALAFGWLLGSSAETRALRASGTTTSFPARRHLPHLLLVIMMTLGWVLHSPDVQLPSRMRHAVSCVLAGAAVVVGWAGLILRPGEFDTARRAMRRGPALIPLVLVVVVAFLVLATPLLQFESGLFPCGENGEFCLSDGHFGAHLPRLVGIHKIILALAVLAVFVYGVCSVWSRWRGEALWLPWLAGAWVATLLFRDSFDPPLTAFALHQAAQWLLILGLLRLASRQGSEAGFGETDRIGTSGNKADGSRSSPKA